MEDQFTTQELQVIAQALSQITVRVSEAPILLTIIQKATRMAQERVKTDLKIQDAEK